VKQKHVKQQIKFSRTEIECYLTVGNYVPPHHMYQSHRHDFVAVSARQAKTPGTSTTHLHRKTWN